MKTVNKNQAKRDFLLSQPGKEILVERFSNPSKDCGEPAQYSSTLLKLAFQPSASFASRDDYWYRGRVVSVEATITVSIESCSIHQALLFWASAQNMKLPWGRRPIIWHRGIPLCPEGSFMKVPSWHPAA